MIAALFVDPKGPYFGREDIDPWDESRDARKYSGPHPVIAHPPCARWGKLWWTARSWRGPSAPGKGEDDGCFEAALKAVRAWGGVLEHPQGSFAWEAFGLPRPVHGRWERGLFDDGWSCEVDQGSYGHRARKRTWLYYVGKTAPFDLDWTEAETKVWVASGPGGRTAEERRQKGITLLTKSEKRLTPPPIHERPHGARRGVEVMTKLERRLTPQPFADLLIKLVRLGAVGAS